METGPIPGREPTALPRVLGPTAAFCVIVGSVIGSGIFVVPAKVAGELGAIGPIVLAWIVGGLFSLAGALTLAELGAMLPRAGGPYVYLREAYGPLPAFLFGWAEFLVVRTGSMATLAAAFAMYAAQVAPAPDGVVPGLWQLAIACAAIAAVAVINVLGTRVGGRVQVFGTALKIAALAAMVALPFLLGKADAANLRPIWPSGGGGLFRGAMVAMVSILWAYDGWVNSASLAEEIVDPGRNIPRTLVAGVIVLILVYLSVTLAYHLALPMPEIARAATERGSPRVVAGEFFRSMLGAPGLAAIALVVMASTFISLNGNALSGPREYFAMARDGLFPAALGRIHPRFLTPANAIVAQTVWAIALSAAGTALLLAPPPPEGSALPLPIADAWRTLHEKPLYDVLYTYVIFGGTIFYTLAIAGVFVLRRRRPDLPRPYRTTGYPLTPLLYVLGSTFLLFNMLYQTPVESLAGLAILALGLVYYSAWGRSPAPDPSRTSEAVDDA